MHDTDRDSEPATLGAFGALWALVLCCTIVGVLAYTSGRNNERRNQAPAAYSQSAKQNAKTQCANLNVPAAFECIYEKVEASQDQARGQQDLTAQQQSAFAALSAAFLALLTLFVTAVGVVYVKRTLDATLKAVEDTGKATDAMIEANRIAMLAQRPWIDVSIEVVSATCENKFLSIYYDVVFKNIGGTVADRFWPQVDQFTPRHQYEIVAKGFFDNFRLPKGLSDMVLIPSGTYRRPCRYCVDTSMIEWESIGRRNRFSLVVVVSAFYHLPGDTMHDQRRHVEQTFMIGTAERDPLDQRHIYLDSIMSFDGFEIAVTKVHPSSGN